MKTVLFCWEYKQYKTVFYTLDNVKVLSVPLLVANQLLPVNLSQGYLLAMQMLLIY